MSTRDDQNKKRLVITPAATRRQEETGREDPTEPDEVGGAKLRQCAGRTSRNPYGDLLT